jgi:CUG-BP- and ETR3-like factor
MAGMHTMGMDPYYMMQQQQQQQQQQQPHYGMPGMTAGYDQMQQYAVAGGGAYGGDASQYAYASAALGMSSGMPQYKVPGIGGGASHAGPPGANVFVHNIPFSVDESYLMQMFSRFGSIVSTRVVRDPTTQQSKGYGFVSFTQEHSALAACAALDGQMMNNRKIKVEIKDAGGRGRSAGAGNRANPY